MVPPSNARPSVLFVGNFASGVGYAWRFIEDLWIKIAEHPALADYEMRIVFRKITTVSEKLRSVGWATHELAVPGPLLAELRFLREHRVEVMYLTDRPFWSPRYLLYRWAGVKTIIVHDHTPGLRSSSGSIRAALKRLARSVPGMSCDAAFGVGRFIVDRIIRVGGLPPSKVHRVTNGIPPGDPPPPRTRGETVRIITVSRADQYKRIDFAIDVMAELVVARGVEGVHYVFCGDGPDLESFKQRASARGVSHVIEFAGRVSDVPERLLEADIAIHPSRGEALSLAILEYMRAGMPVVVSDNPSVNSPLAEGVDAFFFREGDVSSAADVLERLIDDPDLREEMGRQARRRMEEGYSRANMLAELETALSSVFPLSAGRV